MPNPAAARITLTELERGARDAIRAADDKIAALVATLALAVGLMTIGVALGEPEPLKRLQCTPCAIVAGISAGVATLLLLCGLAARGTLTRDEVPVSNPLAVWRFRDPLKLWNAAGTSHPEMVRSCRTLRLSLIAWVKSMLVNSAIVLIAVASVSGVLAVLGVG